ncbi:tRNA pseudouridine(55) synthase TruB [Alteribacter natronophilus]|uniref:tRNA pseudouridine(55) synthase TruB n=1 Tax=Alteribacter natronophilus TaxID=2583810 RepID=UPI00110EA5C5|nr:tRNA pseudouridine(55) synthase TruB [Alteribacter natronophilus]TMW73251.1 tRNA pseudouridine(55) synthase TruB [Alteribacter natronophilus]
MTADGILPLWKERGKTSFDCVRDMQRLFRTKKVGHTGTLDPDVEGVLPICIGRATKLVQYLTAEGKEYEGEATIGFSTTTEDASGELVKKKEITETITEEQVRSVLMSLTGDIEQTPPMYSAVKVGGRRLYEYARQGIEIERPSRQVTIYSLELTSGITRQDGCVSFRFRASCSKGTYIRTLAVMMGEKLGYPAHMSDLVRTAAGSFSRADCLTETELRDRSDKGTLYDVLLPYEYALKDWPSVTVDKQTEGKIMNGAVLPIPESVDENLFTLYNQQGECLAIYKKHPNKAGMMKPEKMLKV